jgi:alpha-tubulin suppressor-like RCC1 family protein
MAVFALGAFNVAACESPTASDRPGPTLISVSGTLTPTAVPDLNAVALSVGSTHACAITIEHEAVCWGMNDMGQLGTEQGWSSGPPLRVAGNHRFTAISAGEAHTCATSLDARLYCWGLGLGETPVLLSTVPFARITAGGVHGCGVTADGSAYCWGSNSHGQAGNADLAGTWNPEPLVTDLRFDVITAGESHSCGAERDGVAWCWGYSNSGRLGSETTDAMNRAPVRVAGDHKFRDMSAGENHTCGVADTGNVYCWGVAEHGRMGNRSISLFESTPVQAVRTGNVPFASVVAGDNHSCALDASGAAHCWGANDAGQLGTETDVCRVYLGSTWGTWEFLCSAMPVAVTTDLRFTRIEAGLAISCGLHSDGRVLCWGDLTFRGGNPV